MNTQALWSGFHDHLHTLFTLEGEPFPGLVLELVEVSELRTSSRLATFSILFYGPGGSRLEQGSYSMQHPDLGALGLFLVPVRADAGGYYYEAVFNHLIPAG